MVRDKNYVEVQTSEGTVLLDRLRWHSNGGNLDRPMLLTLIEKVLLNSYNLKHGRKWRPFPLGIRAARGSLMSGGVAAPGSLLTENLGADEIQRRILLP
eukprot:scaffold3043_cov180-Amphora_coffeaeformis.AAC.2